MCGIAGILSADRIDEPLLRRMIDPIRHRGPDDEGIWIDRDAGIGLGHRRLSIVDLSPHGHQPMASSDGRFVLSYNGEIYNHEALRSELEKEGAAPEPGWRGHSDTETLIEAIAQWGLDRAVERSVGMFAFALWDRKTRTLSLVRDRFGEKPLYYGWAGGDFLFGSELKALRAHPGFDNAVSRRALHQFAARTYVPAPLSIYEGVFKLLPGCMLVTSLEGVRTPRSEPPREGERSDGIELKRYWSYRRLLRHGLSQPITDVVEAVDRLEQALGESIRDQSMADVPVGAFLSGGIDSSTVVALYQRHSPQPVRTFSIGFAESGYNEAEDAKRVAAHLGTIHSEHYVSAREASEVIPKLPTIYDEPFADSSQIPTFLVSSFARQQVTVAITGDGGDELFAGYNRYFLAPPMWQRLQQVPKPVRWLAGNALARLSPSALSRVGQLLPMQRQPHSGGKLQKASRLAASAQSFDDVYTSFLDEWSFEQSPVRGGDPDGEGMAFDLDVADGAPPALRMMYCDAVSYLPDDILCKVDRASMAVSLETRVPFLDHRVAELASRIPLDMKIHGGKGKQVLRSVLRRHVPDALLDRPKMGFGIPVGEWIRGPLRPWAEALLDPARLASEGWFDPAIVRARWNAHLSGTRDSAPALWAILMFQAWVEHQRQPLSDAA